MWLRLLLVAKEYFEKKKEKRKIVLVKNYIFPLGKKYNGSAKRL